MLYFRSGNAKSAIYQKKSQKPSRGPRCEAVLEQPDFKNNKVFTRCGFFVSHLDVVEGAEVWQ